MRIERIAVILASFFLYPGYYFGLSIIFKYGMSEKSLLYYTLPVRLLLAVLMLYVVIRSARLIPWGKLSTLSLVGFSVLYVAKIIYTDSLGWSMSKSWIEFISYYLFYFIIPFFFFSSISFSEHKRRILNTVLFSGLLLGVFSIYMFSDALTSGSVTRVSRWTFEDEQSVINPLSLAYSGTIILTLCVYKLMYDKNSKFGKIYIAILLAVALVLFYLGASRGTLIVLILSLLVFVYFGTIGQKFKFVVLLAFMVPIVFYGAERTGSAVFERAHATINEGHTSGREPLLKAAYDEFVQSPLLGGRIEVSGVYPHNLILELMMGTGVIGTLVFLLFLGANSIRGWTLATENTIYLVPILIFICAFSQHMVSFSLYGAMMLAQPLGMFNSRVR